MSESLNTVGAITMFIEDVQRSKAFYARVFGAEVVHEDENAVAFRFENMVVNLLRVSAAHDLIAPAPVGGAEAARRFQRDYRNAKMIARERSPKPEASHHRGVYRSMR